MDLNLKTLQRRWAMKELPKQKLDSIRSRTIRQIWSNTRKTTIVPCESDRKEVSFEWSLELKSYNQHGKTSIILSGRKRVKG